VYSEETVKGLVDIARRHDLVVMADEIYEKIIFDDAVHHAGHAARASPATTSCASPSPGCPRPTGSAATAPAGS
jgi:alanine-synthesizing transaminase